MARSQLPKPLYVGGSLTEKLNTAAFGPIAVTPGFEKAAAWLELLMSPHLTEAERLSLTEGAHQAFTEGEAGFFEALAFLTKNKNAPLKDRLRYGLIYSFHGLWGQKLEKTREEVLDELAALGFPNLDERQLRRMCKEVGIKLVPGRTGRPKKPGH